MKRILIIVFIIVLLFCVSCNGAEGVNSDVSSSGNVMDYTTENKGVSTKQLQDDISKIETVKQGIISSKFIDNPQYQLQDFVITKRQINANDKKDIIYCTVTISNQWISSTIDYKLTYIFYDVGGWILENTKVEAKQSTPLVGVDFERLNIKGLSFSKIKVNDKGLSDSIRKCDLGYDVGGGFIPCIMKVDKTKLSIASRTTDLSMMSDTIELTYSHQNYSINSKVEFLFDQNEGWISEKYVDKEKVIMAEVKNVDVNWDRVVNGDYYFKGGNSYTGQFSVSLSLQNYNPTTKQVKVDYRKEKANSVQYSAKDVIGIVNEEEYSLTFDVKSNDKDSLTYIYNFIDDQWYCDYGALGSVSRK